MLDEKDLWARKAESSRKNHQRHLEREAAAEREAEEKRQRLLRED